MPDAAVYFNLGVGAVPCDDGTYEFFLTLGGGRVTGGPSVYRVPGTYGVAATAASVLRDLIARVEVPR